MSYQLSAKRFLLFSSIVLAQRSSLILRFSVSNILTFQSANIAFRIARLDMHIDFSIRETITQSFRDLMF
jgi:hypothetical protein